MTPAYRQKLVGDVRILVLGPRMMTEGEFDAHMAEAVAMSGSVRVVLLAIIGAPNMSADRRAKLVRAGLMAAPTAVLTDSAVIRGILTALNWFGGNVRPFPLKEVWKACDFLGVAPASRPDVVTAIEPMVAEFMPQRDSDGNLVDSIERTKEAVASRVTRIRRTTGGSGPNTPDGTR